MTVEDRYVLVTREGVDTVHRNPLEQCNLDDSKGDRAIDEFTAERMLLRGDAVPCKHCIGDKWG